MHTVKKLWGNESYRTDQGKPVMVTGYAVVLDDKIVTCTIGAEPYFTPRQVLEVYSQKMPAQKMADYYNGKVMEFPKVHERALKSSLNKLDATNHPGWHHVPMKTSEYLCKRLALYTDWHEFNIMDAFKVAFDWRLQRWMVSV